MEIKSKKITLVNPRKIKAHPKNNNRHPIEQIENLARIIEHQGFRVPLIVSNLSGYLVSGHARLLAARKLKLKEVPVIYEDFDSEQQEWAYLTSDNAIGQWSELDMATIKMDLETLGEGFDIDLLGLQDFSSSIESLVDPEKDWEGMPEFTQKDKTSFRHVIVHFASHEDAKEFFKRIDQKDTGITKTVWFPPQERMDTESKRYGQA